MDLTDIKAPDPVRGAAPWHDPDWLAGVDLWIGERCVEAGFERAGSAAVRGRPWSVVVRVPTRTRTLWFKANPPGSAFEPALLGYLARRAPDMALPLVAVDTARAWSLSLDSGRTLADLLDEERDIGHWHTPLGRYARLQHELTGRVDELLDLGVPDLRPAALVQYLESAVCGADLAVVTDQPDGISCGELNQVRSLIPTLASLARELESIGIGVSLDHADLHSGNVFLGAADASHPTPFDWGDASITHPFSSLLVTLRSVMGQLSLDSGHPDLKDLCSRYLAPWIRAGYARPDLDRAVELALRLAPVVRARAWDRMFDCYAGHPLYIGFKAQWLAHLLADDPLVG
jgi:hypothetical protein